MSFLIQLDSVIVRPANTETGRVKQSAVIHCQIRLVYSESGVIAYVLFTRATRQGWPTLYISMPGKRLSKVCCWGPGARFTNVLSAKKFVSSFLRTVCVSQTPSTYEFLKDFAKIFLNIVVTLRQGGGDLIFQKIS